MSHQSPLIALPFKTTTDVDFAPTIKQAIAQSYGERPDAYDEECAALNRCRSDAVNASGGAGAGSDATARDLLLKYFGQLEMLELRFVGEQLKVSYTWNDAFTSKPTVQSSLAFEKASVIHLLAARLTSIARSASRASPEGIKRAYAALRQAAGLLQFINENFLHAPSTDLSREVVGWCCDLMLAQAGEVFVEKCLSEKKPVGLVSKMAQQVASAYTALTESAQEQLAGKGIVERNWLAVVGIKAKHFASLAQTLRAKADADKADYGAGVVRLGLAVQLATEAQKLAKEFSYVYVPPAAPGAPTMTIVGMQLQAIPAAQASTLPSDAATSLLEITKAQLAAAQEAKKSAERDNDLVYHAVLPSTDAGGLPAIESLPSGALGKPQTIQEIYAQPEVSALIGADIFKRLVPLEVHEQASVYSEEKAKLVRAEAERCDVSEAQVRAALDDLRVGEKVSRLGALLDSDRPQGALEPSREILSRSEEIRNQNAREGPISDLLIRLEDRRRKASDDLAQITRELDEENRECERMRAQHGHLFSQPPASQFTRQWRTDIRSHSESLTSAENSDQRIQSLWREVEGDVGVLAAGRDAIQRAYASHGQAGGPSINLLDAEPSQDDLSEDDKREVDRAISEIEAQMNRLAAVRQERDDVLKDFKEKVQADDVSHLLLLNRRSQDVQPTLFQAELEKFRPYQSRISAAIASQGAILQAIAAVFKSLDSRRGVREAQRKQSNDERSGADVEARFRKAAQAYDEVRTSLQKGLAFYDQMTTLIDGLRREVRQFTNTRAQERSRMSSDADARSRTTTTASPPRVDRSLESQFGSMGLGGHHSPPTSSSPYPQPPKSPSYPAPPQRASAASPYDFSSLSNLPSAFSSQPYQAQPPSQPYSSPPPTQQHYAASPAPAAQRYSSPSPSSPYPPPPPSQPSSHIYGSMPPPPSQHTSSYSSSSAYGSLPPPPQAPSYRGMPPPPGQLSYGAPPPPPSSSPYPPPPPSRPQPPYQGYYPQQSSYGR